MIYLVTKCRDGEPPVVVEAATLDEAKAAAADWIDYPLVIVKHPNGQVEHHRSKARREPT